MEKVGTLLAIGAKDGDNNLKRQYIDPRTTFHNVPVSTYLFSLHGVTERGIAYA
jgi:hypothetical protein